MSNLFEIGQKESTLRSEELKIFEKEKNQKSPILRQDFMFFKKSYLFFKFNFDIP